MSTITGAADCPCPARVGAPVLSCLLLLLAALLPAPAAAWDPSDRIRICNKNTRYPIKVALAVGATSNDITYAFYDNWRVGGFYDVPAGGCADTLELTRQYALNVYVRAAVDGQPLEWPAAKQEKFCIDTVNGTEPRGRRKAGHARCSGQETYETFYFLGQLENVEDSISIFQTYNRTLDIRFSYSPDPANATRATSVAEPPRATTPAADADMGKVPWRAGAPHPDMPNVLAGTERNSWQPADGYVWADADSMTDLAVKPAATPSSAAPALVAEPEAGAATNGQDAGVESPKPIRAIIMELVAMALVVAAFLTLPLALLIQLATRWVAGFKPRFRTAAGATGMALLAPAAALVATEQVAVLDSALVAIPLFLLCYPIAAYCLGTRLFPEPVDRDARLTGEDYREIGLMKGFAVAAMLAALLLPLILVVKLT